MTIVVEKTAGVVLAGGRSSRMGSPKAALDWHGSTLLRRTVAVVARAVTGPVVVVRAPGQQLPDLPPEVEVASDPQEGKGPVQGIAVGPGRAGRPGRGRLRLLHRPAVPAPGVRRARVLGALAPGRRRGAAGRPRLPAAAGRRVPRHLAVAAERLVKADRLRPGLPVRAVPGVRLDDAALRADPVLAALDPDLDSVVNVNEPAEYERPAHGPRPR